MQEIAFAMAATDDDVNVEMSELPTFSLGFDLFGGDTEDIGTDAQTNASAKQHKSFNSVEQSNKVQFTKISPHSSGRVFSPKSTSNSNQNVKNSERLPTAQYRNKSNSSAGQKVNKVGLSTINSKNIKNVGHSATNNTLSAKQVEKNIGYSTSNSTLSSGQNAKNVGLSSVQRESSINSPCFGQNVKETESKFSKPQNIMNSGAFKWSCSNTSTRNVTNKEGTVSKNQQQKKQFRTEKNASSLVQSNTQTNNKWSWSSTSSGRLSHSGQNGLKDVTNMDVKPTGSSGNVKSVPTAFVSVSTVSYISGPFTFEYEDLASKFNN